MIGYFLKSGVALSLFYLGYKFLFEKDSFLVRNRIYLLFTLVISFMLPLIPQPFQLPVFESHVYRAEAGLPFLSNPIANVSRNAMQAEQVRLSFSWELALLVVYLSGVGFMLFRFFAEMHSAYLLIRRSEKTIWEGQTIFLHEGGLSHFSFFHWIFLNKTYLNNDSGDRWRVIAHEQAHIRQAHGFDLFLSELALVVQWFNPLVWMYRKSLVELHEYLADQEVLNNGCPRGEYQAVLVNQALGIQVFHTSHSFNHVNLKKRIQMMTKIKSSRLAHLKVMMLLPIFFTAILLATHVQAQNADGAERKFTGKVVDQSTGNPLEGAHIILQGTTMGTKTSSNGTFSIKAPEGSELIISYVGYTTSSLIAKGNDPLMAGLFMKKIDLSTHQIDDAGQNQGVQQTSEGGEVHTAVETMPAFPGGNEGFQKFINENLKYPETAMKNNISGKVFISFVVNEQGKVEDLKVERSVHPDLDAEALRVIGLSPAWVPGTNDGKPVKVQFTIPIQFDLPKDVFVVVEEMPSFQGGDITSFANYVRTQIKYPEDAEKKGIQGKVLVTFIVDANGKIKEAWIEKSENPSLDAEALRILKESPAWTPGKQGGQNVPVQLTMPVVFSLQGK